MPGRWRADWTFQAWAPGHELRVQFPPSYVLAGSATAEFATPASRLVWQFPHNGYQAEWLHVADVAQGREAALVSLDEAVEDLHFALLVADGAAARLQEQR